MSRGPIRPIPRRFAPRQFAFLSGSGPVPRPVFRAPRLSWSLPAILGFLAIQALVLGLAVPAMAQDSGAPEVYRLGNGDVIAVSVIEDPSLDRRLLIGPDGRVNMPLAGSVLATGKTISQVQASIRRGLAASFVTAPNVTVSLAALAPPEGEAAEEIELWDVYVIGEVRAPGRFEYEAEEPITALQALALAGGPAVFAARNRIQIRRTTETGSETLLFDYDALEEGQGEAPAGFLADGDVIVVPERGLFD